MTCTDLGNPNQPGQLASINSQTTVTTTTSGNHICAGIASLTSSAGLELNVGYSTTLTGASTDGTSPLSWSGIVTGTGPSVTFTCTTTGKFPIILSVTDPFVGAAGATCSPSTLKTNHQLHQPKRRWLPVVLLQPVEVLRRAAQQRVAHLQPVGHPRVELRQQAAQRRVAHLQPVEPPRVELLRRAASNPGRVAIRMRRAASNPGRVAIRMRRAASNPGRVAPSGPVASHPRTGGSTSATGGGK